MAESTVNVMALPAGRNSSFVHAWLGALKTPQFIGNSLNWMGLGFLILQTHFYFDNFPSDSWKIRLFVWTILVLELFQTASTTYGAWFYMVQSWGNEEAVLTLPWTAASIPIAAGLIGWLVQMFYARRIWGLAGNNFMKSYAVFTALLSTAQGLLSTIVSIVWAVDLTTAELTKLGPAITTWISLSAAVDVLVAVGMLTVLSQARSKGLWEETDPVVTKTDSVVMKLINLSLGTGFLLAVLGVTTLLLYATVIGKPTFQYDTGLYIIGKLYSNSAMVALNARKQFRRVLHGTTRTSEGFMFPMSFQHDSVTQGSNDPSTFECAASYQSRGNFASKSKAVVTGTAGSA